MYKPTVRQTSLLGRASTMSKKARARLHDTWADPFQKKVMPLLYAAEDEFAPLYFDNNGRPNWSIARRLGICLLQELLDLPDQDVLDSVAFDFRFQHALEMDGEDPYLSRRSLVDFRSRLVRVDPEMKLVRRLFDRVAAAAIADLRLSISTQRMDSTQVTSNIRTRGRVDLFNKTLHNFLRELQKTSPARMEDLSEGLGAWFRSFDEDSGSIENKLATELRQLAAWAVEIVRAYEDVEDVCSWESWELVRRLVREHCRVVPPDGGADGSSQAHDPVDVVVLPHADKPGTSLQSPYDPDAGCGHKGVGYSVHLAETTGNAATEILTDYDVRPSSGDWGESTPSLRRLEAVGLKPKVAVVDAGFPNATALLAAAQLGVDLLGPVSHGTLPQDMIGRDEFEFSSDGRVVKCPGGHAPVDHRHRMHANQATPTLHAYFDGDTCRSCPLRGRCVARGGRTGAFTVELRPELLLRDTAITRQRTDPSWAATYRQRAGIEATNSELKRRHGLGRLRVRRRPRVALAVSLKVTACNAKRWMTAAAEQARRAGPKQ